MLTSTLLQPHYFTLSDFWPCLDLSFFSVPKKHLAPHHAAPAFPLRCTSSQDPCSIVAASHLPLPCLAVMRRLRSRAPQCLEGIQLDPKQPYPGQTGHELQFATSKRLEQQHHPGRDRRLRPESRRGQGKADPHSMASRRLRRTTCWPPALSRCHDKGCATRESTGDHDADVV